MSSKSEFYERYCKVKDDDGLMGVTLYIHMPNDEVETISNPNVADKVDYILETYTDDLVHTNNEKIYIVGYEFVTYDGLISFGEAIEFAKEGFQIARKGWNGKSQYVELARNISYINAKGEEVNVDHDAIGNNALAFIGTSGVQIGWLASQADMLAEDWYVL